MKKLTIFLFLLTPITFDPFIYINAHEMTKDGCIRVKVDYKRNCGAIDMRHLTRLTHRNQCVEIEIDASSPWNASGILFEKGVSYRIEVPPTNNPMWCDAGIQATENGWSRISGRKYKRCGQSEPYRKRHWCQKLDEPKTCESPEGSNPKKGEMCIEYSAIQDWIFRKAAPFRRAPEENWFQLIGIIIGDNSLSSIQFPIRSKTTFFKKAEDGPEQPVKIIDQWQNAIGEFCSFANDLYFLYENNCGSLKLKITRTSD